MVTARRLRSDALKLDKVRQIVNLHHMNSLVDSIEKSSNVLTGRRNTPTMRSASDKDNISMYSGLRRRRFTRIDASTRRLTKIIVKANNMKNTMFTITSGLRSSEKFPFSAGKLEAFVMLILEVFGNMVIDPPSWRFDVNCSSASNVSQQKLHHAVILVFSCYKKKRITKLAKFLKILLRNVSNEDEKSG